MDASLSDMLVCLLVTDQRIELCSKGVRSTFAHP
jgi:hypothetical protein